MPRAPSGISTRRSRWAPRPLPIRALLATRDFAAVRDLLDKHRYAESESLLTALEEKYGKLPWFTANKPELDAAAKEAKRGLREKEAEAVYAQAAGLFRNGDLYELKPVVERLKTQFADSAVAADPQRKPSLAELDKAVADLGPLLRVRKDGKGDAKTIQEAVNKAAGNATIQIEEAGPWTEQIVVPAEKDGLTICGKKGLLPVITAAGGAKQLRRKRSWSSRRSCRWKGWRSCAPIRRDRWERRSPRKRPRFLFAGWSCTGTYCRNSMRSRACGGRRPCPARDLARNCVFFGRVAFRASCSLENVLVCGGGSASIAARAHDCAIARSWGLSTWPACRAWCPTASFHSINAPNDGHKIEHCDVFGDNPYTNQAARGQGLPQDAAAVCRREEFRLQAAAGQPLPEGRVRRQRHGIRLHPRDSSIAQGGRRSAESGPRQVVIRALHFSSEKKEIDSRRLS